MQTFCTIVTANYFAKAAILYKSLKIFDANISLKVFIADDKPINYSTEKLNGIEVIMISDLAGQFKLQDVFAKYAYSNSDHFRWAAKPLLMLYLLEEKYDEVIYADCDLFFVNNYQFLFDELKNASVLLSPHWANSNPLLNETKFLETFNYGVFNAGFIGASKKGIPAMEWWAGACHYKMGNYTTIGIYDDQKYLDAIPAYFSDIKIIQHKGCNVATWNIDECKRILINGQVTINGNYPIVFFHFTHEMIKEILKGHDKLLGPYVEIYYKLFEDEGVDLSNYLTDVENYKNAFFLKNIKWRLKIKTRIKKLLLRIIQTI